MPRVKRGTQHVKRRKNILARTKGMMWGRKNRIKLAKTAATKAGAHAYVGRKLKKRFNRGIQQIRINAAARINGTTYSKLMGDLKKRGIDLDRKVLAEIAVKHPEVFAKLVKA
ncbi:50S ribosomal protein L20 [Candidatus Uhrbacteria bacterium CG22_combo_CG10-13_8_21_14_all_47_17]|uniref:50S ribosomal protein L20 n=1 Tax=Candidatus Uhrbacteria bacterium CG22_combo_CG10-13_8_21_14_all_47_17 TaxID=1975041 RepID=A0A2H0BV99_9BACT|nr:MAG: 50S ribosomal protein L20 [Candidatus Uhrbacteria bacterium CG22_combo_CG10-13_8_21_14_all_47_17]